MDQEDSSMLFKNVEATRIAEEIEKMCDVSLIGGGNIFERDNQQFWAFDTNLLAQDDIEKQFQEMLIQQSHNCLSVNQIVDNQIASQGDKNIYRVRRNKKH